MSSPAGDYTGAQSREEQEQQRPLFKVVTIPLLPTKPFEARLQELERRVQWLETDNAMHRARHPAPNHGGRCAIM